ncbi:flagellar filament capping protein FliD [Treponema zioleckii]|uniref:flagellar filament capping protein FliD n=1 Tax=Treponema zioleckii TaxID=331680 RepID=UPI00168AB9FC|nr:flagellar filament capping protein FliD [Treponema zioleckii]
MAEISIPGVSDKYKTKDYIEALMQKERLPLTREQEALDRYKEQQSAWRGVNQRMTSLRESTKTLYSFDNPFNNKLANSSDERAITAEAGREAAYDSIKVDVITEAKADRFLSSELEKNSQVPKGKYTFKVAEKTISFNWKGGKLTDFVTALNKRGNNTIKVSLVGVSNNKQALLIESLKTGAENNLIFQDDALSYALANNIVEKSKKDVTEFGSRLEELSNPAIEEPMPEIEQDGMLEMTTEQVTIDTETKKIILPPRSGFTIQIDPKLTEITSERIDFSYSLLETEDITEELNIKRTTRPELPDAGNAKYDELIVQNQASETSLPPIPAEPLVPISGEADFYVRNKNGSELPIKTDSFAVDPNTGERNISISVKDFPDIDSVVVRNRNTGTTISMTPLSVYDEKKNLGYSPINPVSEAGDAIIKYNGITINRPNNKIDDVIPHVTLNVHQPTEKTATIDITSDKESAKDALIQFVGNYNQVISEMNILSENKPEIVSELSYLSKEEQEDANKRLGMFQGDFSLSNGKTSLRNIISGNYKWSDEATITMLAQIGISTRASGNGGGSYNAAQMRGYLEIDEKKLDSVLDSDMEQIKNLFGFDSDGDLVIDSGIGFALDKQLTSWVQSGGIIATKNAGIDSKISLSETKIKNLESQMGSKESQLRQKYSQMEGTLNNLNAQSNSLSNFANSRNQ